MSVNNNHLTSTLSAPLPDPLRRQINAEVATLGRAITRAIANQRMDPLSQRIINLYEEFRRSGDLMRTIGEFKENMQEILHSPMFPHDPFDRRVYLGSDDHTYGRMALSVYLHDHPPEEGNHYRSPMNPHLDVPFTVERHWLAEVMVKWLHDAMPRSQHLEDRYAELKANRELPLLPTRRLIIDAQMQHMMARRQQRRAQQQLEDQQFLHHFRELAGGVQARLDALENGGNEGLEQIALRIEGLNQIVTEQNAELQHEVADLNNRVVRLEQNDEELAVQIAVVQEEVQQQALDNRRVAAMLDPVLLEQRRREELGRLLQQLQQLPDPVQEQIAEFRREMDEQFERNAERIDAVEQNAEEQLETLKEDILGFAVDNINHQIFKIETRNEELRGRISELNSDTDKAERDNLQIQLSANKLKKAIKKREGSWVKGLLMTSIKIGACALTTYGASYFISGLAVTSTGGSGMNVALTLALSVGLSRRSG